MRSYDLKRVLCTVGTVPISGYTADGGIEYEWQEDIGEVETGADGDPVFSRNNNKTLIATITLRETSLAYTLLAGIMEAQQLAPILVPLPFQMTDPSTGDSVAAPTATFLNRPAPSKMKKAGARVFRIALSKPIVVYGAVNTPA